MFECFKSIKDAGCTSSKTSSFNNGKAKSKSVVIKEFMNELIKVSARTMESNFSYEQLQQLYLALFPSGNSSISFPDLLESLNHHGQILKKPGNIYKLCVS